MTMLSLWLIFGGSWTLFGTQVLKPEEGRKPVSVITTTVMLIGAVI